MTPQGSGAGYSGTPLAGKLGLKQGMRVLSIGMPAAVRRELESAVAGLAWVDRPGAGLEAAHLFTTRRSDLAQRLASLRGKLAPDGMVWVSWPKKASGVATDITEDRIREIALPLGLVDIKVCAIDAVWSGLKLVIRRELRADQPATPRRRQRR
jgi:hypothetical protein